MRSIEFEDLKSNFVKVRGKRTKNKGADKLAFLLFLAMALVLSKSPNRQMSSYMEAMKIQQRFPNSIHPFAGVRLKNEFSGFPFKTKTTENGNMFSPFPLFLFLPENNIDQHRSTKKNVFPDVPKNTWKGGFSWIDKIDPVAEMSHWHTWSDSLGHVTFGTVAKMGLGKWRSLGGFK